MSSIQDIFCRFYAFYGTFLSEYIINVAPNYISQL